MINSDYLHNALEIKMRRRRIELVSSLAERLIDEYKIASVAVTGWSGALIGIPIADRLNLPLTVIRKTTLNTHSSTKIEGFTRENAAVMLIDDCVSEGNTFRRVVRELKTGHDPMYVAALVLYDMYLLQPDVEFMKPILKNPEAGNMNALRLRRSRASVSAIAWDRFKRGSR